MFGFRCILFLENKQNRLKQPAINALSLAASSRKNFSFTLLVGDNERIETYFVTKSSF